MAATIDVAGLAMPAVGLGLWKIAQADTPQAVIEAIEVGYRHLDSAADYGNEMQAGDGIRQAIEQGLCSREELWITSKLWNTFHRSEHVRQACEKSLADLQVDYLDLYLIHFPISLQHVPIQTRYPPEWIFDPAAAEPAMKIDPVTLAETWAALESLVEAGLVKNIGVCNYNSALLHDLMAYARIKPAMLQIESHPYLSQEQLIRTARDYGMAVTAFSPLGALSYVALGMASENDSVLVEPAIVAIAGQVGRTPAQVVLRWGIQRGTAIIPKTTRRERLLENLDLFDFSLDEPAMAAISALNCNRRFNDPGVFCELTFNKFYAIYD